jgi:2-methylcitrate dehydratase PrpD
LIDSEVGPRQVLPPRIHDAALLDLADRVTAEIEEEFDKTFPAKALAEVIVDTRDGLRFVSGTMKARWEPPSTLPTDAELEEKFFWLVEPVLGSSRTETLASTIWEFEKIDDIKHFINLCVVERAGE